MIRLVFMPKSFQNLKRISLLTSKKIHFLIGIIKDDEVYQIEQIHDNSDAVKDSNVLGKIIVVEPGTIQITISNEIEIEIKTDELRQTRFVKKCKTIHENETNVEIISSDLSRLFIRTDNHKAPLGILNNKKIAIIGMGSGGSLISFYLAKAGIKNFILIDDDVFLEHNIIRHFCSMNDIGRFKTLAVKEFLKKRIPDLKITTFERKFKIDTEDEKSQYEKIFSDIDLLISATGDHGVNFRINKFAYENKIKTIYAGTFDKIFGGIMIRIDPEKKDACYQCIYNKDNKDLPDIKSPDASISYDRIKEDLVSIPGLGIDIDNITIIVTKFILSTLLEGEENGLNKFPYNLYTWYNYDKTDRGDVKFEGLELYYLPEKTPKRLICNICATKVG